jgi:hypothetical protein
MRLLLYLLHLIRLILLFLHLFHQYLLLAVLLVFHLLVLCLAAGEQGKHSRSEADWDYIFHKFQFISPPRHKDTKKNFSK